MTSRWFAQSWHFLTGRGPSVRVADRRDYAPNSSLCEQMPLRTFTWWFAMGTVLTLAVLMVQGGIRDLLEGPQPASGTTAIVSFGTTILGGGLLAGCLAVVLNRLR